MSNNIFSLRRFSLLFKQFLKQDTKLLLYGTVIYLGAIFLYLSIAQLISPLGPAFFKPLLIFFTCTFGLLYVGTAFPAFRAKEKTINYLMLPASTLEKFLFELITRIGFAVVFLPLLFWIGFNLQGYCCYGFITNSTFEPISLSYLFSSEFIAFDHFSLMILSVLLFFLIPFMGASIFTKYPLVKTLFSVMLLQTVYGLLTYFMIEITDMQYYHLNETSWLVPVSNATTDLFKFAVYALTVTNLVMLVVTFLKIKEKEV